MNRSLVVACSAVALALSAGCAAVGYQPAAVPPPASPDVAATWAAGSFHDIAPGRGFGYTRFGVGLMGLPGCDDMRPGTAFSLTVPPGGVILSVFYIGALAAIASQDNVDVDIYLDATDAAALGMFGMEQGYTTGRSGPMEIQGVGMDCILSWGSLDDLSAGGGVSVFTAGLGARLIGGLWQGGLWHLLAGFEGVWIDYDFRPYAFNFGPYVGAGLEAMLGPGAGFNASLRYGILAGDATDYDHWEFTVGFILYW
ncbi:MAG: hypothetical protein JW909_11830 [Planctomycetes bacterium]|nr:hypothetical protein [Planctomycetota bacterium]